VLAALGACAARPAAPGPVRPTPVAAVAAPELPATVVPTPDPAAVVTAADAAVPDLGGPVTGRISWYGRRHAGRATASGERFDPKALTMAHRELPFGTRVRVTDLTTGTSVVVRVNDRGPFVGGRVADVSYAAARRLGIVRRGVITAELEPLAAASP
jgi:rare lipoprotein A